MKDIRSIVEKKIPIKTTCQTERNRLMQKREWFIEKMVAAVGDRVLTREELTEVYHQLRP